MNFIIDELSMSNTCKFDDLYQYVTRRYQNLGNLACQPLLLKKRERVWGIVHTRCVPVKEFPNTNQIA